MKKGILVLFLSLFAAAAAFCVYFFCATAPARAMLAKPEGELDWLRHEFNLTDAQFVRISEMHAAYRPKCDEMCVKIAEANSQLDSLIGSQKAVTPEIEAALKRCASVQEECRQAMLGHAYAVSNEMGPGNGSRYLKMVKARVIQSPLTHDTAVARPRE